MRPALGWRAPAAFCCVLSLCYSPLLLARNKDRRGLDESEEVHVYGSILQVSTWLLEEDPANESTTLLNHAVHHTSVLPNCLS